MKLIKVILPNILNDLYRNKAKTNGLEFQAPRNLGAFFYFELLKRSN